MGCFWIWLLPALSRCSHFSLGASSNDLGSPLNVTRIVLSAKTSAEGSACQLTSEVWERKSARQSRECKEGVSNKRPR